MINKNPKDDPVLQIKSDEPEYLQEKNISCLVNALFV